MADLSILDALREDPTSAALMLDVDGTLAPIVNDPAAAAVPPATRDALAELSERYLLVACVSGRLAADARRIVGLDQITYVGNHGLELLEPGATEPRLNPAAGPASDAVRAFTAGLAWKELSAAGVRLEDKGPIQALHWRGAGDLVAAEALASDAAVRAEREGLSVHRGRLVIELRPSIQFGKGLAVHELVATTGASAALYAGDDRTDLDAFAALRDLVARSVLQRAVCVGVASAEGPEEIQREADLVVGSSSEVLDLLRGL